MASQLMVAGDRLRVGVQLSRLRFRRTPPRWRSAQQHLIAARANTTFAGVFTGATQAEILFSRSFLFACKASAVSFL